MRAPLLPRLFDEAIATAELDPFSDALSELLPEEAVGLPHAHPLRLLEYRGGRHAAREAQRKLGVTEVRSVPRAMDRSPVWPAGLVGSITHTRRSTWGFCGAAVARERDVRGIGVDVEVDDPLDRQLWDRVLLDSEKDEIERRPEREHGYLGKLLFSAKESVYKCQHPLSHQFLEFHDVEVLLAADGLVARLLRAAGPLSSGTSFDVRFLREGGLIATATTLR
ncbi:MAG TPA: 4'-phosphopantetheinyl transferase superfamily protein [Polyangiaceae bacterium]|nr:4'-phosphopantetheinyl transferase superfamily protein [Polyangiaceae bacterium]